MPKKEKRNQPLANVAFRFPGSLAYMLQCSCQAQVFLLKPENRSKDETGCPRRLSSFRACPHPTGSSRLIDSAGSDLAGTARTERAQSLSSVLLASARQRLDNKGGKYLGFKRKVKRYSDKLISDKIIFLNCRQTFYQNTRKTCGRRRKLSIFFKFLDRRHPSMGFNQGISYPAAAGSLGTGLDQCRAESAAIPQRRKLLRQC